MDDSQRSLTIALPPIVLRPQERNAAIRAYNARARDSLTRGEMIDTIIAAINEERTAPSA